MNKKKFGMQEKNVLAVFECFQVDNRIKGLREQTIMSYMHNIRTFMKFLDERGITMISEIKKETIKEYVEYSQNRGIKPITINTYLRAVKRFLYYAMENHYIDDFKISLIKVDFEKKEPYSESEMKKLIKKPDIRESSFVEHRTWVAICYMCETGNRQKSVVHIKVSDVDLKKQIVNVRFTKNRKGQISFISKKMAEILDEYIVRYELQDDDYLFPNERGGQLAGNSLYSSIKQFNELRGVKRTGTHGFRRFFATHSYKSGVDTCQIQDAMGHHSLEQTMQYITFDSEAKANFSTLSFLNTVAEERKVVFKRGKQRVRV